MEINFVEIRNLGIRKIYGKTVNAVESVTFDSRRVGEKSVFICVRGENHDGHTFAEKALQQGAVVIVGDNEKHLKKLSDIYQNKTFVLVANVKIASARLSSLVYGACEKKLRTVAVTGTNGKTTVTAFVKSLFNQLKLKTGAIGTLGITSSKGKMNFKKSTPTTPEAPDLHHIFRHFYLSGEQAVAMEVSSIAIEEQRVESIEFDIGIHTNISPEHLEYHQDFNSYKQAKLKLFSQVKKAVVNLDDKGMRDDILENFQGPFLTYSLNSDTAADLIADNIKVTRQGSEFEIKAMGKKYNVITRVIGDYNIANLLSAVGAAIHLGFSMEEIVAALPEIENPEGRLQLIQTEAGRTVILDYAHTPVALDNLLTEVKKLPYNRLIVLIAGIGIRDFEKMPKMAAMAEYRADEIVVSVDHPGFHDPQNIVDQVMTGFTNQDSLHIHQTLSRKEGVLAALSLSKEGDIIVLTSGCINGGQIVKNQNIPHSDEELIHHHFKQLTNQAALKLETSCMQQDVSR